MQKCDERILGALKRAESALMLMGGEKAGDPSYMQAKAEALARLRRIARDFMTLVKGDRDYMRPDEHTGKFWCWLAYRTYSIGLSSASVHWWLSDGTSVTRIIWRGKRCYFLGWPRHKWRCVLTFRHWPTPWLVGFGFCGRCCPWPCCGAITVEHAEGCPDG